MGRGGRGRRSQIFDGVKASSSITNSILSELTHTIIEMLSKIHSC
jgi:hypothetical protein